MGLEGVRCMVNHERLEVEGGWWELEGGDETGERWEQEGERPIHIETSGRGRL